MDIPEGRNVAAGAARIVAAFARTQRLTPSETAAAILAVGAALASAGAAIDLEPTAQKPAANLRRLVKPDTVVCAECGHEGPTLKRHLASRHGLTPDAYRTRWRLRHDHPMVAPAYSERRAEISRRIGLGTRATVGAKRVSR